MTCASLDPPVRITKFTKPFLVQNRSLCGRLQLYSTGRLLHNAISTLHKQVSNAIAQTVPQQAQYGLHLMYLSNLISRFVNWSATFDQKKVCNVQQ